MPPIVWLNGTHLHHARGSTRLAQRAPSHGEHLAGVYPPGPDGRAVYNPGALTQLAGYTLLALDDQGQLAAKAHSIPFRLPGAELPMDGWDGAIRRGVHALVTGATSNAVSALEIYVRSDLQGRGVSSQILTALGANARRLGFTQLLAPVRPQW